MLFDGLMPVLGLICYFFFNLLGMKRGNGLENVLRGVPNVKWASFEVKILHQHYSTPHGNVRLTYCSSVVVQIWILCGLHSRPHGMG